MEPSRRRTSASISRGAVVTPGLVNTHHHLYQTLTRARAQEADLFAWLRELYPVWAGIDAEAEYAAARTGLAELALSGLHDRLRPPLRLPARPHRADRGGGAGRRASSACGSSPRAARWTSASPDGGLPPDELVEEIDAVLADTERLVGSLHEPGPGARVQIAVAPCSPFSVTKRLMTESAELARQLGLKLHTHLAETVEEEAYCLELYGCTPVEYLADLGWLGGDVWCAHCVHLSAEAVSDFAAYGHRRRALPDVEPPPRRGRRAGARLRGRRDPRRSRRRRLRVERAQRPPVRGEAGAARRARARRAGRR